MMDFGFSGRGGPAADGASPFLDVEEEGAAFLMMNYNATK